MSGRVVVDNSTGRPVPVWGCDFLFQVLLVGQGYRPEPTWLTCLQQFTIPIGESSYPVTISASYNRCSESGGPGSMLPCMAGGQPPPLLPGDYHAVIFAGHRLFRLPPPVAVRVIAAP
jgi:hypothetical protein